MNSDCELIHLPSIRKLPQVIQSLHWTEEVECIMNQGTLDHSKGIPVYIDIIHSPINAQMFQSLLNYPQSSRVVVLKSISNPMLLELQLCKARARGWTGDTAMIVLEHDLTEAMYAVLQRIVTGKVLVNRGLNIQAYWSPSNVIILSYSGMLMLKSLPSWMRLQCRAWRIEAGRLLAVGY
ncbi:Hypothetical protein POVR2_LOCUS142 [uncultured virus]|nr:Hypothetical protein POVR2_LOCUS142 [uncultured virus]